MEKEPKQQETADIGAQPYKGPSAFAAGAGEGFIAHFVWAAAGLIGGGLLTYTLYNHVKAPVEAIRNKGHKLIATEGKGLVSTIQRGSGRLMNGIFGHGANHLPDTKTLEKVTYQHQQGFGLWLTNHSAGLIPGLKKWVEGIQQNERVSLAVTGGGIFAFVGYFIVPIILFITGSKKGNQGRKQFEAAQDEIWDLRAENDILKQKNSEMKTRLVDHETTQAASDTRLQVSKDDPVMRQPAVTEMPGSPEVQLESPVSIEPPKIEAPKPAAPPVQSDQAAVSHATRHASPAKDADWAATVRQQQHAAESREPTLA